jgi:hypothetical protein
MGRAKSTGISEGRRRVFRADLETQLRCFQADNVESIRVPSDSRVLVAAEAMRNTIVSRG